ncbi:MAG: exonuclease domain-containing protein [Pseudomonadota bacterium]|nr:exonuclease domain-containing protein [Pseudomonadota bacterium]
MGAAETQEPALLPQDRLPPRDGAALPQHLVFVDLETTGGNAAYHRITEVGIVRMERGEVVEEWSSLVNPECRIPAYIEAFTGITNEMVAGAPRFADIAGVVLEKLQAPAQAGGQGQGQGQGSALFVAHNARFDYSFLRTEFRRLDVPFSAKVLCTVKLSRRLFPEYPRHNLDAVMQRHQLTCTGRHRALGDARVLGDFWTKLRHEIAEETLAAAAQSIIGAHTLPAHLPPGLGDELPEGPGVYRLFAEDDVLLYIGKSHSLRSRILGHFDAAQSDAKEQKKARQTRRIDWLETAGVLGAQLKEAEWIKELKPLYNKRVKSKSDSFTLQVLPHVRGVGLRAIGDLDPAQLTDCFGVFHTQKDARKALTDIARAHSLCLRVLGLEDGDAVRTSVAGPDARAERDPGSCLAYQVGKCKGACIGKEPLMLHTVRLKMALSSLKLKPWPFPGRIALREGVFQSGASQNGGCEYHVLDHWVYLGTARSEEELSELAVKQTHASFDVDVYRIVVRYLAKNPAVKWHDLRDKCTL